jgi:DNA polymerase-3 subunit gamma/tau
MSLPQKQNLYRKYRPACFADLAGQEHVSRTIQSSVASGRISHAYMFSGPRGTGKTSSARLLAKILNCLEPVTSEAGLPDCCCKCDNCQRIDEQNFMDIIEIDAASNNSVEDIRQMREKVKYKPVEGKYKIYIIDEVHMLSGSAFNAFLKTLEEPPENVIFVLATTDPQKVPATIISRCQGFDFHSVARHTIKTRLAEIVEAERQSGEFPEFDGEALGMIAECAQGGFRDALSLLDQIASSAISERIDLEQVLLMTRRLSYSVLKEMAHGVFEKLPALVVKILNELYFKGYEPQTIARDFLEYLRKCMILKIDPAANQLLDLPEEQAKEYLEQIKSLSAAYLVTAVTRVERSIMSIRNSFQARILLESELIRLSFGQSILATDELEKRIEMLEQKVAMLKRRGPALAPGRPPQSYTPAPATVRPAIRDMQPPPEPVVTSVKSDPATEFRNKVAAKSKVCSALLLNAKLQRGEDGVLTILIEQDFALSKLKEEKNVAILHEVAKDIYGKVPRVIVSNAAAHKAAGSPPAGSEKKNEYRKEIARIDEEARQKLLKKPAISDAIEVFGGEILDLES